MIEWNTVKYIDCMDEKEGLPSLPDKSIDLCLTDPPYNIGFKGKSNLKRRWVEDYYDDSINRYWDWNEKWFKEIERICEGIVFTCGNNNLFDWIIYKKPPYQLRYWYRKNACGYNSHIEAFVFYGTHKNYSKLRDVFEYPINLYKELHLKHPSPKSRKVWMYIISKLQPTSVIDPFIGSGTTAEVCTKLGIPWIGYEINEVYKQDIDKRLNNCKKEPKQVKLCI